MAAPELLSTTSVVQAAIRLRRLLNGERNCASKARVTLLADLRLLITGHGSPPLSPRPRSL